MEKIMKWSEKEIELIKRNYPLYGSDFKINRTKKSINKKAAKLGLKASKEYKAKKISERLTGIERNFKSKININDFINPNKYTSYILGILWGDGYISKTTNSITLECIKSDMDEIESIFDSTGCWNKYSRLRNNRKEQTSFNIADKKLHQYLVNQY
jgi:hypothetical protein